MRVHDRRARAEDLGDVGIREQVDVALAVALLDVGEAVPLVGRRQERLAEVLIALRLDRELVGARLEHRAFDADVVGEIDELDLAASFAARQVLRPHERLRVCRRGVRITRNGPRLAITRP